MVKIMGHDFKAACLHPTLRLLNDDGPERQIIGHERPWAARANLPSQGVENGSQRTLSLWGIFVQLLAQA